MIRVEKTFIKSKNPHYKMLADYCYRSRNLYNHANHVMLEYYQQTGKIMAYTALDKELKNDEQYPDYYRMPTVQSAQQTLRRLTKNWKAYTETLKLKESGKVAHAVNPPKYIPKNKRYVLELTNQDCKIKGDYVCFPKVFDDFTLKPACIHKDNFEELCQVRIVPNDDCIVAEVVYEITDVTEKEYNGRCVGIDIGVNQLLTVCNNVELPAIAINGRPLKEDNRWYNEQINHYIIVNKAMNGSTSSKRINKLSRRRNTVIEDYLHKATTKVIDYCVENDITKIVIGDAPVNKIIPKIIDNKEGLERYPQREDDYFRVIPFRKIIHYIKYKAENKGIVVDIVDELYTSTTSFIDGEIPNHFNHNPERRVNRGLFISDKGIKIDADLNAAYQILNKKVSYKWNDGCALRPIIVNISNPNKSNGHNNAITKTS